MGRNIDDPFEKVRTAKSKPLSKASKDDKKWLRWKKQEHYRLHLPLTFDCLSNIEIPELRFLANQFRAYCGEEAREWEHQDYIRFIAGHQNDPVNLKPMPPIPAGELPTLRKSRGLWALIAQTSRYRS